MARLCTEGFDVPNYRPSYFTATTGSWVATRRPGVSAGRSYYLDGAGGNHSWRIEFGSSPSEVFIRFAIRGTTLTNNLSDNAIQIGNQSGSKRWHVRLRYNSPLHFYLSGTLVGSTSESYLTNNGADWLLLEIHIKLDGANGKFQAKANGVLVLDWTGDTSESGLSTGIKNIDFINTYGTRQIYVDDLAVNDVSGSQDNSWCGDGYVIPLLPNANGASSDFTGSDGNSTDNYALVDEESPSTADYVQSATGGHTDWYGCQDPGSYLSVTGIDTVKRVWTTVIAQEEAVEASQLELGIYSGGNAAFSAAPVTLDTAWKIYRSDEFLLDPNGSVPWTESAVNSLQAGFRIPT